MYRYQRSSAAAIVACGVLRAQSFTNPLLPSGPDPWVTSHAGFYYYMHTTGNNLTIWRTHSIADLSQAERKVVWRPPVSGPYSRDIWAPELHFLRGKWYIYFAADAGTNASHRVWVLENESDDPLQGEWRMKGKAADSTDRWAIDATVLEDSGRLYMIWSGWEGATNGTQSLYIAEMADPWTIKGARVRISTPEYTWEKIGDLKPREVTAENPAHVDVNEGPEILRHGRQIFVIYSASGCWTDSYSMGMLSAEAGSDLLKAASWKKSPTPVFLPAPENGAYAPGHGSFFRSPDGTEDWMIYHANAEAGQGCGRLRAPRAQRFTWKADGTPNFGRPVAIGVPQLRPAGEAVLAR